MRGTSKESMAGVKRIEHIGQEIFQIFIIVQVLHQTSTCFAQVESSGQAFIQTDNELRLIRELMPGKRIDDIDHLHDGYPSPVLFDPPMLDFHKQPVGMPHMEQVTVQNTDLSRRLHLLSISGSTLHFHCSFFQHKNVPAGGNTTFEVVFLARQEGNVENTLYIHTSVGSFKYQVFGVGVSNPYRVRPFLGAKVPVNSSFSPLIHMHNPHGSTLQVEEIYTSGGDLHLELPTGETDTTKEFWEIPPYHTKPIMKASFVARSESNHTSFIRIKTSKEKLDQVLILPVEVEVSSLPGIYSTVEMIDFGIVRSFDEAKVVQISLLNSGDDPIHLSEVVVEPPNSAVSVDFTPVLLKPGTLHPTVVASVSYTLNKSAKASGEIVIKSKSGQQNLRIPYQATILRGSIAYDRNKTLFYTGHPQYRNISRELMITNAFPFTLVVHNATVPPGMEEYFTVERIKQPVKLSPKETKCAVKLVFHPNATHLHFTTTLTLHTNASVFNIPLYVYNGRLKVIHHRPEIFKGQLDFGTMGIGEERNLTFTLRNDNPLDVIIREYSCNMDDSNVVLLGIEQGNGTMLTVWSNSTYSNNKPLILKPHHFAVFSVNLKAPEDEGTFAAEVIVATQFDYLYIPMTLRSTEGVLRAREEKLLYEDCFPGKVLSQELHLFSSFEHFMEVRDITFNPNDTRFFYVPPKEKHILLEPNKESFIGNIYFDMKRECLDDCYVGLSTTHTAGHHWLLGSTLDRDVADVDQYLYTRLKQHWDALEYKQSKTVNVTIQLDTNQVRGFLFPAQAHLHWPQLLSRKHIRFPLTQIGNLSNEEIVLENPSDSPVLMQLLPLSLYPNAQTILDLVGNKLKSADLNEIIESDNVDVFTLQDHETYNKNPNNRVPQFRNHIETVLGVRPHPETLTMLLSGKQKMRITLGFRPIDDLQRSTLIVLRNNLTIIDVLSVQGIGGRGEMKFGNKKAGSQSPLLFDLSEKHLKNCQSDKPKKKSSPNFTVKRSFTAKNTGQLPFYVQGFSINGVPCEGFGFKILDCTGFELEPNTSRKIEISFTPDFTMSRMQRVLIIHTSLGPDINYTLQATLPPYMLSKCASALPRPIWESTLYFGAVGLMLVILAGVVLSAYLESDRIYTQDIMRIRQRINAQVFDKSKVLDLARLSGKSSDTNGQVDAGVGLLNADVDEPNSHGNGKLHNGMLKSKKDSPGFIITLLKKFFTKPKSKKTKTAEKQINDDSENATSATAEKSTSGNNTSSSQNIKKSPDHGDQVVKDNTQNSNAFSSNQNNDNTVQTKQPEKDPLFIKLPNNKKHKATKRQHNDHNNQKDTVSSVAKKESTEKQKHINKNKTSTEADSKEPIYFKPVQDEAHNDESFTVKESQSSKRKGKGQSRATEHSYEDKNHNKPSVVREKHFEERDVEDSSSTTTETSSLDVEEKNSSARDSTPEPQPPMKKARNRKGKKLSLTENENDVENEFMITSKSKAHKNIKVDPKTACGGDIFKPSTIELPYTTKLEAESKKVDSTLASLSAEKVLKKNFAKRSKNKGRERSTIHNPRTSSLAANGMDMHGRESPIPSWDRPMTPVNDLEQIAIQTSMFEARRGRSNLDLSSSSRSSSYSSVVSTGNTAPDQFKKTEKVRQLQSYNLDSTDNEVKTVLSKAPGDMAPRPPSNPHLPPNWSFNSTRSFLPPSAQTVPKFTNSNSFGLDPIGLSAAGDPRMESGHPDVEESYGNINAREPVYPTFDPQIQSPKETLVQKLLAERRKRTQEYQKKFSNDWPGFNSPLHPQHDTMWWNTSAQSPTSPLNIATDQANMSGWSTFSDSPPKRNASSPWGNDHSPATNSPWEPPSAIWGNAGSPTMNENQHVSPQLSPVLTDQLRTSPVENNLVGFDTFSTSIWTPNSIWGGFQPAKLDDEKKDG